MDTKFVVRQKMLSMSECERLCGRWSREIEELAHQSGWHGVPGERVSVPVGTALNMLVLSTGMNYGVELHAMASWLPGLRNEALLKLGEDTLNWSFNGTHEEEQKFWPELYGNSDAIRPRVARLLGCCSSVATRQLRFYSQSDIECLSNSQYEMRSHGRAPLFTIDAHTLADKMRVTCGTPLFTAMATYLT